MDDTMKKLKINIVTTRVLHELKQKHFSICFIESCDAVLGKKLIPTSKYKMLYALHCVDWADMLPDVRKFATETIQEYYNTDNLIEVMGIKEESDEEEPKMPMRQKKEAKPRKKSGNRQCVQSDMHKIQEVGKDDSMAGSEDEQEEVEDATRETK